MRYYEARTLICQICYSADFRLILCTVTNSSPWPYFWGTKNFDYIFENLLKKPLVLKCLSFLNIFTITMWKRSTLVIKGLLYPKNVEAV